MSIELSGLELYEDPVLVAAAMLTAACVLIASVLVQRRRRREVEAQVRRAKIELRASEARIRHLGGRLLSAQEAERSRIARDLHDDVAQQLSILISDLALAD